MAPHSLPAAGRPPAPCSIHGPLQAALLGRCVLAVASQSAPDQTSGAQNTLKYLAIDFGTRRIGLAVSDPEARLAFPLKTVYKTTRDKLFAEILAVLEEYGVQGVVLGLPHGPVAADGQEALIVRQVMNFATRLKRRIQLPIHLVDEEFTSKEAEERLRQAGLHGKKLKEVLDQQAAARILEAFIQGGGAGNFPMV